MNAEQDHDYGEEAERLKALDVDQQRKVIELHHRTAADPRATRADHRVGGRQARDGKRSPRSRAWRRSARAATCSAWAACSTTCMHGAMPGNVLSLEGTQFSTSGSILRRGF